MTIISRCQLPETRKWNDIYDDEQSFLFFAWPSCHLQKFSVHINRISSLIFFSESHPTTLFSYHALRLLFLREIVLFYLCDSKFLDVFFKTCWNAKIPIKKECFTRGKKEKKIYSRMSVAKRLLQVLSNFDGKPKETGRKTKWKILKIFPSDKTFRAWKIFLLSFLHPLKS